MSTPTLVAPATDAAGSLPYNIAVPGAVIGTWADDSDQALFVAPDKLLALLLHAVLLNHPNILLLGFCWKVQII